MDFVAFALGFALLVGWVKLITELVEKVAA